MQQGPDWFTRERGLALAGLLGLFVAGVVALAMILGVGGEEGAGRVAAVPAATATPTPTPTPTATPTPTPVPLTPEERAERRAAAEQLRAQGFAPVSLKAYDPDQTLRVLLGEPAPAAQAAGAPAGRRAFFFVGGQFIGTDASEPSAELRILDQTENTVTLRYGLNTGGSARVRFKWAGGTLAPQSPIPPAAQRQG